MGWLIPIISGIPKFFSYRQDGYLYEIDSSVSLDLIRFSEDLHVLLFRQRTSDEIHESGFRQLQLMRHLQYQVVTDLVLPMAYLRPDTGLDVVDIEYVPYMVGVLDAFESLLAEASVDILRLDGRRIDHTSSR